MSRVSLMTWKCLDDAKCADYGSKNGNRQNIMALK